MGGIAYEGFLSELAECIDDQQPSDLQVGLLAMRAAEATLGGSEASEWGVPRLRAMVADLDDELPVKNALRILLRTIEADRNRESTRRARIAIWRYGRQLEFQGRWAPAVDVFEALIRISHPSARRLRVRCLVRIGHCFRWTGDVDAARTVYRKAIRNSRSASDWEGYLLAHIGMAQIAEHFGDFVAAEARLRRVRVVARKRRLKRILGKVLHELGAVAFERGNFERAATLGTRALRYTASQHERYRVLADVAVSLMNLGMAETSRNTLVAIAAHSSQQGLRANVLMNLIELESALGNFPEAQRYERLVATVKLTPVQLAYFYFAAGGSAWRRGDLDGAEVHFRALLALATEHRLAHWIAEAESSLAQVRNAPPPRLGQGKSLPEIASEVDLITSTLGT